MKAGGGLAGAGAAALGKGPGTVQADADTKEKCEAKCTANEKCKAYSFGKPKLPTDKNECKTFEVDVKADGSILTANPLATIKCTIKKPKAAAAAGGGDEKKFTENAKKGCMLASNKAKPAASIDKKTGDAAKTPGACAKECLKVKDCLAFYFVKDKECNLQKSAEPLVAETVTGKDGACWVKNKKAPEYEDKAKGDCTKKDAKATGAAKTEAGMDTEDKCKDACNKAGAKCKAFSFTPKGAAAAVCKTFPFDSKADGGATGANCYVQKGSPAPTKYATGVKGVCKAKAGGTGSATEQKGVTKKEDCEKKCTDLGKTCTAYSWVEAKAPAPAKCNTFDISEGKVEGTSTATDATMCYIKDLKPALGGGGGNPTTASRSIWGGYNPGVFLEEIEEDVNGE